MENDVGVDAQNQENQDADSVPIALDNKKTVPAEDVFGMSTSGLSQSQHIGPPKLTFPETEDPKPGPSNSAAEFDLEVFDSGSSCSNEECWDGADEKGNKECVTLVTKKYSSTEDLNSGHLSLVEVENLSTKLSIEAESECESETEQMEEKTTECSNTEIKEHIPISCDSKKVDKIGTKSQMLPISDLPSETTGRKEIVELCKLSTETDVIVQDHDIFGTDENDDDSLDSLILTQDNPETPTPGCDLGFHPQIGCDSCASSISVETIPALAEDQDESTVSGESIAIGNVMSSDLNSGDVDHLPTISGGLQNEELIRRTKRKSTGILSEVAVTTFPQKKQKPELRCTMGLDPQDDKGSGSSELVSMDARPAICDTNTASTSPPSPGSQLPLPHIPEHPETMDGKGGVSTVGMIPRPEGSPPLGRNLIPDKDNPPQEILNWVATFTRWSHAERLLAIDQFIDTCEPQQVRHMMQVIEPKFQRDFISLLPKELALTVLNHLEPRDLLRAAQTCQYWRILAEDNLLWREKCREAGLMNCKYVRKREHLKKRKGSFQYSPWKAGFLKQHNIEMNWRIIPIPVPKVLKGHDDHVITCLQFSGSDDVTLKAPRYIVSGSDDNTLKVWNAVTGNCIHTLVGHTGGVWSSQMEGHIIVSGSTDRTLKVWNAESGECVHTLYGHTSTVRCMHLHENKVVSGSRDATLRMWDIHTGNCLHVLVGHVAAVRCVQYDGRLVVSGAYDYMVKVWNPVTEECLHTLSGHTNRVYSLQFDGVHIVSGSLDTSIRVWDVETGACKHALMGHQSLTSGMELKDNILVSGNADSTVKIWDILTGTCLQTLAGPNKHQSAVTCLQFNQKFVITSSDDGTVKLWDVKTGDFIRDLIALESGGSGGVVWRIRSNLTKLVCAVGSRNGTEETKLMVLDFDADPK